VGAALPSLTTLPPLYASTLLPPEVAWELCFVRDASYPGREEEQDEGHQHVFVALLGLAHVCVASQDGAKDGRQDAGETYEGTLHVF
jgi:hypothetical protein